MTLEEPFGTTKSPIFAQNFWGEKHAGFDILSQNIKSACRATSDFIDFLRECCTVDDSYYKSLTKLAKQTSSYQTISTFKPCWTVIRHVVEQIGQLHLALVQDRQNLIKDVQKYLEEQQKRQKSVRDSEASTQEVVHAFQVTSLQLQKAKMLYHARYAEYQRLMRSESASAREQERMEGKLKKAQHEYKYSIEKYNNLRNQFVTKMHASCIQFQEIEVAHLEHMREFLLRFGTVWSTARDSLDKVYSNFNQQLSKLTTEHLLDVFVKERGTGSNIPQGVAFEDAEVASLFVSTDKGTSLLGNTSSIHRASSALAVCDSEAKDNCRSSEASLNGLSGDSASVNSVPLSGGVLNGPATTASKLVHDSKRRLFKRYRGSPHEPSPDAVGSSSVADFTTDSLSSTTRNSVSAFNLVVRLGSRHFGTSSSSGKDKLERTAENKSHLQDWQHDLPAELPKDEEGFSIPPSDPWASGVDAVHSDSDQSSSDSEKVDVLGRSFRGLKVEIRPAGQLAPNIATLSSEVDGNLRPCLHSNRSLVPVLYDHRGNKLNRSSASDHVTADPSGEPTGSNLIKQLPIAPVLPPPPAPSPSLLGDSGLATNHKDISRVSPATCRFARRRTTALPGGQTKPTLPPLIHHAVNSIVSSQPSNVLPIIDKQLDLPSSMNTTSPESQPTSVTELSNAIGSTSAFGSGKAESHSDWLAFDSDSPKIDSSGFNQTTWPIPHTLEQSVHAQPEPPARAHNRLPSCPEGNFISLSTSSPSPSFVVDNFATSAPHRTVPVAAAFVETWQARFFNGGGSSFSTTATITPPPKHAVAGSMTLAFPIAAVKNLVSCQSSGGRLLLRLNNAARVRNVKLQLSGASLSDRQAVTASPNFGCSTIRPSVTDYVVDIPETVLIQYLTELVNSTPTLSGVTSIPYVRLNVLTYDVDLTAGPSHHSLSPPINLCTYWRCERDATDFRLDYTTHWPSDDSFLSHDVKGDLHIAMNVDGDVSRMQSLPAGVWVAETHQAVWKIPLMSTNTSTPISSNVSPPYNSSGTVRAKFVLNNGPGRPQPVSLQFVREECLASGLHLALESSDYRLSLCKRRIIGDNYICDPPSHSSRFQLHPLPQALNPLDSSDISCATTSVLSSNQNPSIP